MAEQSSDALGTVEQALGALLEDVSPLESETLPLAQAGGRVLAGDQMARLDVPAFDNSAMDGYALRAADAGQWLPVSQRVAAGSAPEPLEPGTCARLFTGAPVPSGADCVVMQERVEREGERARFPAELTAGDSIRRRGRDVASGSVLLAAGTWLDAAALGHLAGQGVVEVEVRRRPRVALLSTGDEVIDPGTPLGPGQLYNTNRPMLTRLLESFGAEVGRCVSVPDDFDETRAILGEVAFDADVVISTGGVSVGEEDHVKHALESLGRLDLWRLAIRPGKPLALGRLPARHGDTRFIGLPGNPVSSFVGAWLFLRPLMGALSGCPTLDALPAITATADFATRTGPRSHYMRAALAFTPEGPVATAFADQNSGVLSSCVGADVLVVVPANTAVAKGDAVTCLWIKGG
ncbi:molybdopterin molybdotransferase MoeA [Halomonas piscis]|uniref:Molybdopterin molybdenumtransferase n=1 Tax=Halomonas piscis TaxID=3031727 RepID=A0ABY9YYV5_9GAMM|nr:gephyrin-like molybdotransferase Glp [Halomonas piscis]WNK19942.1 molybdopterin molybdotransferase MoeA [Halomonas piscis]